MKYLSLLLVSFIYSFSYGETILSDYYWIVSSELDTSIPKGKSVLEGTIKDYNDYPVVDGLVSNFIRSAYGKTDDKGSYSFTAKSSDTSFFFYHPDYGEIVIWSIHLKDQHRITINFITSPKSDFPVEAEKPVIYLYGNEGSQVHVDLSVKGDLTFSYPVYDKGWDLMLGRSGELIETSSGKTYPYLFWEGASNDIAYQIGPDGKMEAFVLESDTCVSFLENSLQLLGLNEKESTDFITYWAPRMMKYKDLVVQFIVDDAYGQEIANLSVQPQPESIRRVYMVWGPKTVYLNSLAISQPKLQSFSRKGFTVVEWGGSELNTYMVN